MSGDQPYASEGWGHRIREENRGLREKIAKLRKESGVLERKLQNAWKMLDHVPGGLLLVKQEKILFANDTALRESGYARREILSLEVSDLLKSDAMSFGTSIRQGKAGDPFLSSQNESFLITKNGQNIPVELRTQKTLHKGRTAFLFHIVPLDQRKAKEKRRRHSERVEALLGMAMGFRRELEACSRLLQEGFSRNQGPDGSQKGVLRTFKTMEAVREKEALLSQHLHCLARIQYDPSELTFVDLNRLLETAVDISCPWTSGGPQPNTDPVRINTFLRAPSRVFGCASELRDVFVNILVNAVEALSHAGEIYLSTEEHSGFAHVYIQDNGVGMPGAIVDRIFDPFFTTKDGLWRGLGLSLTHAIVDRHQGEVAVTSQEGRGSTFIVKLPLARDPFPTRTPSARKGLRDSHLLIIGDDGILTDILHTLFADRGVTVTVTSSYGEGLRLLRDTRIDLTIADQNAFSPYTDRITRRMKALRPELPVVLINARGTSGSRGMQGKGVADLVVGRPLDVDRFLLQVSGLMGRGGLSE